MALNWIENQPVIFGATQNECKYSSLEELRLVNLGDITQFQLNVGICYDSENLLTNGSFSDGDAGWSEGDGWNITGGKAVFLTDPGYLISDFALTAGYYNVRFIVSDRTAGIMYVTLNGVDVTSDFIAQANGEYSYFMNVEDGDVLAFYADASFNGSIDDIELYELDTNDMYKFAIFDNDNTYVTEINYNDNPEYFAIDKDTLTVSIDWETLGIEEYGCYYICLLDPCVNTNAQNGVFNSSFASDRGWTYVGIGDYMSIVDGQVVYNGNGDQELISDTVLTEGMSYTVTYTIDEIVDTSFNIIAGGVNGVVRTTAGTFTEEIIPTTGGQFSLFATSVDGTAIISSLSVTLTDGNEYECDQTSNKFIIGNHLCTVAINACNDDDAVGFNFETSGFSPMIRINASLLPSDNPFESERIINTNSAGKCETVYFNTRENEILAIVGESLYVHRFLNVFRGLNHFYIDGVEYFVNEVDYPNMKWNKLRTLARTDLEVTKKTQLLENVNTGATEKNCAIGTGYWALEDGNHVIDNDGSKTIVI